MRHFVNFGLLFAFLALAISGAMLFWLPFSLAVARVHVSIALATIIFVVLHIASRVPYFRKRLPNREKWNPPSEVVTSLIVVATLLVVAAYGWQPVKLLIEQGYESRYRSEIVRPSSLAGFDWQETKSLTVSRAPSGDADLRVSLLARLNDREGPTPTIAVWAESTTGSMIETLYLDPRVAYSDTPEWQGKTIDRVEILPIWRHRYTLISGVAPGGEIDAVSGATPEHSFTLDNYLVAGEESEIVLCVEINAPNDPNDAYDAEHVGQPSLLYTAFIDLASEQPYALLELTAHGADTATGALQYDFDGITSAKEIVDLLLAKVERPEE